MSKPPTPEASTTPSPTTEPHVCSVCRMLCLRPLGVASATPDESAPLAVRVAEVASAMEQTAAQLPDTDAGKAAGRWAARLRQILTLDGQRPALPDAPRGTWADAFTGLYRKYHVERLHDPTGKHTACDYFVLDRVHDAFAAPALRAYAAACADEYPQLAADLLADPRVASPPPVREPAPEAARELTPAEWEQVARIGFAAEYPDETCPTIWEWTRFAREVIAGRCGTFYPRAADAMRAEHARILATRTPSRELTPAEVRAKAATIEARAAGEATSAEGAEVPDWQTDPETYLRRCINAARHVPGTPAATNGLRPVVVTRCHHALDALAADRDRWQALAATVTADGNDCINERDSLRRDLDATRESRDGFLEAYTSGIREYMRVGDILKAGDQENAREAAERVMADLDAMTADRDALQRHQADTLTLAADIEAKWPRVRDEMQAQLDAARSEAARARETALFTATGEVSDVNGSVDLDLDEPHEMVLVNGLAKWPTAAFGQRVRLTIEALAATSPTEQGGSNG